MLANKRHHARRHRTYARAWFRERPHTSQCHVKRCVVPGPQHACPKLSCFMTRRDKAAMGAEAGSINGRVASCSFKVPHHDYTKLQLATRMKCGRGCRREASSWATLLVNRIVTLRVTCTTERFRNLFATVLVKNWTRQSSSKAESASRRLICHRKTHWHPLSIVTGGNIEGGCNREQEATGSSSWWQHVTG